MKTLLFKILITMSLLFSTMQIFGKGLKEQFNDEGDFVYGEFTVKKIEYNVKKAKFLNL